MTGLASFVINGQIYCYEADYQNDTHRIFSNHNVQPLIEKLRHVIHNENPARRHYLQFYNDSRAIEFHVRPVPSVSLDEVILEDIDTFSESRKSHQQYGFSDFLQFMSGLFERNQKTVVIATTNYLKFLDDAIATRPVRFNRRYEFKLPGDHELERLFAQFFPDYSPGAELLADCRRRGFSGSHLAEVKRTTEILKHKHSCSAAEIINQAIEIVGGEFHADTKSAGF